MKMTLDLPDELVVEMKVLAATERSKLKDIASDVIRRGLRLRNKPVERKLAEMKTDDSTGLPYFVCRPDAPASKMTVNEILELEQKSQLEEDLLRAGISL